MPAASPHERRPGEARGARDDRRGVDPEPLLQERAVQRAEVARGTEVAGRVEDGEAGVLADHLPLRTRPDDERAPGGAVVGARPVLLRPAPELRPQLDEDAIGEPARLEVALEGDERVEGLAEVRRQ